MQPEKKEKKHEIKSLFRECGPITSSSKRSISDLLKYPRSIKIGL